MAEEARVVERSDKGAELIEEDLFGYKSIHYLVKRFVREGVHGVLP
jgi:hypothetical protein